MILLVVRPIQRYQTLSIGVNDRYHCDQWRSEDLVADTGRAARQVNHPRAWIACW